MKKTSKQQQQQQQQPSAVPDQIYLIISVSVIYRFVK